MGIPNGPGGLPDNKWYEYDISSDTWSPKSSNPGPKRYSSLAFVSEGKIYVAGGHNFYLSPSQGFVYVDYNDLWMYDTQTDSWSKKNDLPIAIAAYKAAMVLNINDKGYLLSGTKFWIYDPLADAWTALADLPFATQQTAYSRSSNSRGYVHLEDGSIWIYDGNSWTQSGSMDRYKNQIHFVFGDYGYYTNFDPYQSGYGNPCYLWEYNFVTHRATKKMEVPDLVDNASYKYINYRFVAKGKAFFDVEYRSQVRAFYQFVP